MILVLAGTGEARRLLSQCGDLPVVASLAGVTRKPKPLGVPTRVGGFGGEVGFAHYLEDHSVKAVLDITHPFATVGHRTARVCKEKDIPYLRFLRKPWVTDPSWTVLENLPLAATHLKSEHRAFLGTGSGSERVFKDHEASLFLRRVDLPDHAPPWKNGGYVIGLPSQFVEEEVETFRKLRLTHLVAKNSGGAQGFAKLDAAKLLGLTVLMVDRPQPVHAPSVTDLDAAYDWIKAHAP